MPWCGDECFISASVGHLDILMYVINKGAIIHNDTCSIAAYNGHIDCLRYAHQNGCKYNLIDITKVYNSECRSYIFKNMVLDKNHNNNRLIF